MTTTARFSAYSAAITLITSTDLNALANGAWKNGGASCVIDNTTDRSFYMDIELVMGSAITAGTGAPAVSLYKIGSANGTTFATPPGVSSIAAPINLFRGSIPAVPSASFLQNILEGVIIPPGKSMFLIQNNLGVAFAASGNTLIGYKYQEEAS